MPTGEVRSTAYSRAVVAVDDGGVDIGEHLELVGAAHVVATAGGVAGDQLVAVAQLAVSRTTPIDGA